MMIFSDFDQNSEMAQKAIKAKQVNGPDYWPTMREVFAYDCETLPFPRFRFWASVHNVPLVTTGRTARFLGAAFNAAFENDDIMYALRENWIGVPDGAEQALKVCEDFDTSMQRVQDVAHLVICGFTPEELKNCKSILEIGGGYGDMCSVVHDMGFKGKYTILDFPEVQKIQNYYLTNQDIQAEFATSPDDLGTYDLVIATWSLSEIPIDYRDKIMEKIVGSDKWLVMYQAKIFGTIDNTDYFNKWFADRSAVFMHHNTTGQDGDNTYMVIK
jgi:hypothetical protein